MNRKGKSKTQVYPTNNSQVSVIPSDNPLLSYIGNILFLINCKMRNPFIQWKK